MVELGLGTQSRAVYLALAPLVCQAREVLSVQGTFPLLCIFCCPPRRVQNIYTGALFFPIVFRSLNLVFLVLASRRDNESSGTLSK